ncbi:MAG: hypothetical protein J5753_08730 [Oscillospiraceae bacterium]|nr:hypothetical protein [Oscillospiraceae bacterium]
MKHISAKISAVLCAATATVLAFQSVTASAYNNAHKNWLTEQTQESTEFPMNFSHSLYYIQRYLREEGITTYQNTIQSGLVLGQGYSTTNISGTQQGATLSGTAAWARYLANCFYGWDTVYTEQRPQSRYSISEMKPGDQVVLSWNGTKRTVFVTSVSDDCVYCSELWGDAIMWNIEFTRPTGNKMKRIYGGTEFTIDYFIRPVKEGDANGDSIVDFMDVVFLADNLGATYFSGKDHNTMFAASDLDGDWVIDQDDCIEVYYHVNENRMNGNYRYVTTWHQV